MTDIKLGKLPDRTPLKVTINLLPELHAALTDYARLYAAAYGREETIADLVPAMLAAFLESDRAFQRGRFAKPARSEA
jgi:hypothetical protein